MSQWLLANDGARQFSYGKLDRGVACVGIAFSTWDTVALIRCKSSILVDTFCCAAALQHDAKVMRAARTYVKKGYGKKKLGETVAGASVPFLILNQLNRDHQVISLVVCDILCRQPVK